MAKKESKKSEVKEVNEVLINATIKEGKDIEYVKDFLTAGDTPLENVKVSGNVRYTIEQCPVCGKDIDMETEEYEQNQRGEVLHPECYEKTEKYEIIELPLALVKAVDLYVKKHPQLGFMDRADVIGDIVRGELKKDYFEASSKLAKKNCQADQLAKSFEACEILLIVKINSIEEFAAIKQFFEKQGKDFKEMFQGRLNNYNKKG